MHVEVRRAGDVVIVDLKGKLTAGLPGRGRARASVESAKGDA